MEEQRNSSRVHYGGFGRSRLNRSQYGESRRVEGDGGCASNTAPRWPDGDDGSESMRGGSSTRPGRERCRARPRASHQRADPLGSLRRARTSYRSAAALERRFDRIWQRVVDRRRVPPRRLAAHEGRLSASSTTFGARSCRSRATQYGGGVAARMRYDAAWSLVRHELAALDGTAVAQDYEIGRLTKQLQHPQLRPGEPVGSPGVWRWP